MTEVGYVDLFATKGVEYILVLFFLAALIVFWRWLDSAPPVRERRAPAPGRPGPRRGR